MRVPLEGVAGVAVHAQVVEIVIPLEGAVVLADPVQFLADEGLDDRRRDLGMVVAPQRIAHVVEQRHHHIALVAAVAMRAGRGLQRMLEPAHRKAAEIAIEQLEMFEHAFGQVLGEGAVFPADDRPVFLGALLHRAEFRSLGPPVKRLFGHIHRISLQALHRA